VLLRMLAYNGVSVSRFDTCNFTRAVTFYRLIYVGNLGCCVILVSQPIEEEVDIAGIKRGGLEVLQGAFQPRDNCGEAAGDKLRQNPQPLRHSPCTY
jgi:hypothetical protein